MTQDQRWIMMWQKYMDFLHNNKRRPSKYQPEERDLVNWAKHNRKLVNKGVLKVDRKTRFDQLVAEAEKYQRVNQHQYVNGESTHGKSLTHSSLTPNPSPKEIEPHPLPLSKGEGSNMSQDTLSTSQFNASQHPQSILLPSPLERGWG